MARKLTKEELEKCKADFDIPQGLKPKYKAAEQAKVSRSTLKKGKAARAACDSPPPKKRPGRPRTNPEYSKVWAVRVTNSEKFMIKLILDYKRKHQGCDFALRVMGDDSIEELKISPALRKYMFGTGEPVDFDI